MLYAGLDIGQKQDHSAIAVIERHNLYRAHQPAAFHSLAVRHIERAPLGQPYATILARVRDVVRTSRTFGGISLAVDATGVGAPVVEMLRAAAPGFGAPCEIAAVTITSGHREHHARGLSSVPKVDLMAGLQVLLESGELRISRAIRDSVHLSRELTEVKGKLSSLGRIRIGADGVGEHDDLVIALALACWRARRKTIGPSPLRLPGI